MLKSISLYFFGVLVLIIVLGAIFSSSERTVFYRYNPVPKSTGVTGVFDSKALASTNPRYASSTVRNVTTSSQFKEYNPSWERIGNVFTVDENDDSIMTLYARPIAPERDLWEYRAEDKDGMILNIPNTSYLESGDTIPRIPGKEAKGAWKTDFANANRWIMF